MLKVFRIAVLILVCLTLVNCASKLKGTPYLEYRQSMPQLSAQNARLFFCRPAPKSVGIDARIQVNDEKLGDLPLGGFFYKDVPAGTHTIEVDHRFESGRHREAFTFASGKDYYFKIWPRSKAKTTAVVSVLTLGILAPVATAIESSATEAERNGPFDLILLERQEGLDALGQCVYPAR